MQSSLRVPMTSLSSTAMANPWCSTGSVQCAAVVLRSLPITSTSATWPRKNGMRSTSHPLRTGYTRFVRIYLLRSETVYITAPDEKNLEQCGMLSLSLCPQVPNLTLGSVYQFRVYAANVVGLGDASAASAPFKCEAWNMPEPGNKPPMHAVHYRTALSDGRYKKSVIVLVWCSIFAFLVFHWRKKVLFLDEFVVASENVKSFQPMDCALCLTQSQIESFTVSSEHIFIKHSLSSVVRCTFCSNCNSEAPISGE